MRDKTTKNPVGNLDAENPDEKKYLHENFIKTLDYSGILKPSCLFISGRKGDGKTAIALMLTDERDKKGELLYKYSILLRKYEFYRSLIFDFREYSLISVVDYTSPIKDRIDIEKYFEKLWEYVIYVSAMKAVVDKNSDEKLIQIRDFLLGKGFLVAMDNFVDLFSRIFREDVDKAIMGVDNRYPKATAINQHVLDRLMEDSFISALETLRSHLNKENRVLVIIDTLEKYYAKEEEFCKAVQGMMEAVYEIKLNDKNKWIDIKCFIPDELYEDFAGWNLNKAIDTTVFLSWKYKELLHFICRRYMAYIERYYDPLTVSNYKAQWDQVDTNSKDSLRSFWNEFFPPEIEDHFRANEDCFNYILRHSQNKPRQIIHLVNQIINCAEKSGNVPKVGGRDVYEGVHKDLNQSLVDNFKPFLDQYQELIECVKTMFRGESNVLYGRIVKDCIKKGTSDYLRMGLNNEKAEKILLRSGLLGIVSKKRKRRLSNGREIEIYYTSFDYLIPGHLNKITNETECALHSILTDYYGDTINPRQDICVYPYAGPDHEGEPDELFEPKGRNTNHS